MGCHSGQNLCFHACLGGFKVDSYLWSSWSCPNYRLYESLEGSFSYEFAYEFAYAIPPIGPPIGYEVDIGYEIIYFNRKLHMLLGMEMNLPGFRKIVIFHWLNSFHTESSKKLFLLLLSVLQIRIL